MNIGHNIPEGSCNACGGTTLPTPTQESTQNPTGRSIGANVQPGWFDNIQPQDQPTQEKKCPNCSDIIAVEAAPRWSVDGGCDVCCRKWGESKIQKEPHQHSEGLSSRLYELFHRARNTSDELWTLVRSALSLLPSQEQKHQPSEGWEKSLSKLLEQTHTTIEVPKWGKCLAILDILVYQNQISEYLSSLLATARREEREELREKVEALKKNPDGTCECGICEKRRVFNDAISSVIDLLTQKKGT